MKISQILKGNKKTIIILLTINLISFFLPYFKQVEWDCEKYYSYESLANYKYEYFFRNPLQQTHLLRLGNGVCFVVWVFENSAAIQHH